MAQILLGNWTRVPRWQLTGLFPMSSRFIKVLQSLQEMRREQAAEEKGNVTSTE